MDWLRRNPLTGLLALAALLLAGVLALEVLFGGPRRPAGAVRQATPADVKLLPQLAAVVPEQAYPESANRPLFTPTRRPAPPVTVAAQPAFQRNQFVLLGVTIAGDTRIAMLRERANGRLHRVERGRDVNGIKVADIQPESVTLAMGAEQEAVPLLVQKAGGGGPPGAMPPGGPAAPFPAPAAPGGPFAPAAPTPAPPQGQPQPIRPPAPGMPPAATPGAPPVPPGTNPSNAALPQPSQAPMTPEELLERRRARRAQQPQ